jgi:hypothetical protein
MVDWVDGLPAVGSLIELLGSSINPITIKKTSLKIQRGSYMTV